MKTLTAAISVAVLATMSATPAPARQAGQAPPRQSVLVTAPQPIGLTQWDRIVQRRLSAKIRYPRILLNMPGRTGIARVKFNCSESGRPVNVALSEGSGNRMLDNAALSAVRRIDTLHPLPAGLPTDQRFEAIILFADTPADPRFRAIERERLARNAWYREPVQLGSRHPFSGGTD
ncbi:energy transducer TonB family protein [Stakelama saccharophila]|uniref:TonB family protein n=1 Tax=Stakelama saccharophila TaxID=3075605 RepID=A0ABZ0BB87_9SPHN|nr:TonB family protein [Stakelama sp. W311]WNO54644.1 TonB family protein [Stakelama sp. W311]